MANGEMMMMAMAMAMATLADGNTCKPINTGDRTGDRGQVRSKGLEDRWQGKFGGQSMWVFQFLALPNKRAKNAAENQNKKKN